MDFDQTTFLIIFAITFVIVVTPPLYIFYKFIRKKFGYKLSAVDIFLDSFFGLPPTADDSLEGEARRHYVKNFFIDLLIGIVYTSIIFISIFISFFASTQLIELFF